MAFVWNPVALPGTLAMLLAWAMAAFVFSRAPHRAQNQLLALVLALEGFYVGSGAGVMYFMSEASDAQGIQGVFVTAMIAAPAAYLVFLSTLESPISRLLRPLPVRLGILALALAGEGYWLTHREAFTPAMVRVWYAPWEAIIGDEFQLAWSIAGVVSLFALVVALSAYRAAPKGSLARERAKIYAIAFGVRDVFLGSLTFLLVAWIPPPPTNTWTDMIYIWGFPATVTLYIGLLVYGFATAQLFDIDLKIKLTLSRGAIVAIFVAVFFVVDQAAQSYLNTNYGWIFGTAAAALLLVVHAPLQKLAERLADTAMPRVQETDAYLHARKMQVYKAALEGAAEDGEVTGKERAMLRRLRDELGIAEGDAAALEREVLS